MDHWTGIAELFDEEARRVARGKVTLIQPEGGAILGEWRGAMRIPARLFGAGEQGLTLLLNSGKKAQVAIRTATLLPAETNAEGVPSVILRFAGSGPAPF